MGCVTSQIMPKLVELDGICTLELKELLKQLNNTDCKQEITLLEQHKPTTNYRMQKIPCTKECKRKHKLPHHQFVKIVSPKKSEHSIAAHLKVAGLTPECILYLTPRQQTRVDRLVLMACTLPKTHS